MKTSATIVTEYGCTLCQKYHVKEIDPVLYKDHLFFQSKHGYHTRPATVGERFALAMAQTATK